VEVEPRFGIKFKAAEMEEVRNVGELVHLIRSKSAESARPAG
jgi:acyl carrier protein